MAPDAAKAVAPTSKSRRVTSPSEARLDAEFCECISSSLSSPHSLVHIGGGLLIQSWQDGTNRKSPRDLPRRASAYCVRSRRSIGLTGLINKRRACPKAYRGEAPSS